MDLKPFKQDPLAYVLSLPVNYGRPRPYRTEDGQHVLRGHDSAWESEDTTLEHLPAPIRSEGDPPPLRKLVLKRMPEVTYYQDARLADPDVSETWFKLWGDTYDLTFARVEDLVALWEVFRSSGNLWRQPGLFPPGRIIAPGTWFFPRAPRQGRVDMPARLLPGLCAKLYSRRDQDPRKSVLRSFPVNEAFGLKALFHFILFVGKEKTRTPTP